MRTALLAVSLIACCGLAHAQTPQFVDATAADNFKVYWLIRTERPVKVDGVLDDAVWQRAEPLADWGTCNYGRQRKGLGEDFIPGEIDCRAAWDAQNLYIAARCYHRLHPNDMVEFRRQVSDVSKEIYSRECLEIHIDGNLDHATRFQSIVNPLGEKMMIWFYDFGWGILSNFDYGLDADWDCAARIEDDHWTIEVRYALADIQVEPRVGYMFGINPCWFDWADSRARDGKRYWWQFVTWSTHDDSHHDPRLYGRFILVDRKPESLEAGLRLAFPDLEKRRLLIQTSDGFLVFEDGKSTLLTYDTQVRRELDETQAALQRVEKALTEDRTSQTGHIEKNVLPKQKEAVRQVQQALASEEGLTRGALAGLRKDLAEARKALEDAYWTVKQDALLTGLADE